jgi:hypothetical protein
MVQVEIEQLTGECKTWREKLRNFRDELTQDKQKLQESAGNPLSKDQLRDVEHLHNQFHIQLINIHDLKQAIKNHDRRIVYEMNSSEGQLSDETIADHEKLYDQQESLEQTLIELRDEFHQFLKAI